ncbi:hypothetical protein [Streptomyces sp. NPDC007984]|uniref:hypothetical protein n=1 Tax=Streptomyces sp. NPDC007984 TaxID=3364801 RepID=UPI0036EFF8A4
MRRATGLGARERGSGGVRGRRLVVLVREGAWGVRDFYPDASMRRGFAGLRVTPCDPGRAVPGHLEVQVAAGERAPFWDVPGAAS